MATKLGFTQTDRALKIDSPLGADKLLLRSIGGVEAISQLFRFELDLLSEDDAIPFDSIVGKNVTLHLEIADGERSWNGFISRFSQGTRDERFSTYHAEMVPWLWFLTRTADCRIFQNLTAPDIIQKIFKDLGFQDYKLQLYSSYRKRDYCVQYRETDFNFVSRLMEEEGIYYFFQHEKGKHTMILADDAAAHQPCPGQPKARCELAAGGWHDDDVITELRMEQEYRPSAWAHTDYNFETPSTNLMVTVQDQPKYEIYDYPGVYPKRGDGDKLAKVRLQETTAQKKRVTGQSTCRNFNTGFLVEVTDHYRKDINQKWLLTAVHHEATLGGSYETDSGGEDGMHYVNTFECIPSSVPFRPMRVSPRPHVQGCQTAVVVGPAGEEIYTDKYGRVKVQFHWDREGKRNENSSCWIRVSHPWAGKGWGSVSIPRIGQEVIVDFLEGDPDQPIIVGRVYHAESMPPYPLPAGGVVSGIKSNSTKGGGGSNEISMNDTKGKEMITIHAQYDMETTVEHDRKNTVKNDETTTVIGNRTETVNKKETITIKGGREESVTSGEKITIKGGRTEDVTGGEKITIADGRTEDVTGGEKITIKGARTEDVTGDEKITITGAQNITVTAKRTEHVGGGEDVTITGATTHSVTGDLTLHSTGKFGQLGDAGVTINGPTITVQASGECNIIGGSKLLLSGPGGTIVIDAAGVTIQGKIVNIN